MSEMSHSTALRRHGLTRSGNTLSVRVGPSHRLTWSLRASRRGPSHPTVTAPSLRRIGAAVLARVHAGSRSVLGIRIVWVTGSRSVRVAALASIGSAWWSTPLVTGMAHLSVVVHHVMRRAHRRGRPVRLWRAITARRPGRSAHGNALRGPGRHGRGCCLTGRVLRRRMTAIGSRGRSRPACIGRGAIWRAGRPRVRGSRRHGSSYGLVSPPSWRLARCGGGRSPRGGSARRRSRRDEDLGEKSANQRPCCCRPILFVGVRSPSQTSTVPVRDARG